MGVSFSLSLSHLSLSLWCGGGGVDGCGWMDGVCAAYREQGSLSCSLLLLSSARSLVGSVAVAMQLSYRYRLTALALTRALIGGGLGLARDVRNAHGIPASGEGWCGGRRTGTVCR